MEFDPKTPQKLPNLPPKVSFATPNITKLLLAAHKELAELKGYSLGVPNPMLLLSPAVLKEALASSEIENIHTTMIEALQNELVEEKFRNRPDKEVLRYREAVMWGFDQMKSGLPVSNRLILGIKRILIPGNEEGYRTQQNSIVNAATGETVYTPPVANEIQGDISDIEKFLNTEREELDPLIKNALAHYQFEALHPFGDGNGRTGRILMVLYLIQEKLLHYPVLFISGYINRNKKEYYAKLLGVTKSGDWEGYVEFILQGFYEQAKETKEMLFEIERAFHAFKAEAKEKLSSIYTTELIEKVFAYPIINPMKLSRELDVHYVTASTYLKALVEKGFMKDMRAGKYHLFINERLIELLQRRYATS